MDRIKRSAAQFIWQAREELGIEGNAEGDWKLAEDFLCECGDYQFFYDIVFDWVKKNVERT
jgi:hypothetical protein